MLDVISLKSQEPVGDILSGGWSQNVHFMFRKLQSLFLCPLCLFKGNIHKIGMRHRGRSGTNRDAGTPVH